MKFKTLILSRYQIVSKDELALEPKDFAKGKWFKGQYNRDGFGMYPIPRVKYVGKKGDVYEFMKEDGHIIKVPYAELESRKYAFWEDKDQSEDLTGYTPPDYSDKSHLEKYEWQKQRGIRTWILDCKKDSNWFHGTHIAFTLKDDEGKDQLHNLMGYQRVCSNLKYLGDQTTEAADYLWKTYGVKIKLGKNLLSLLPINV